MQPDARSATATDFDLAAQKWANSAWFWGIAAGLAAYFGGVWWCAVPAAFALWSIVASIGATQAATQLRRGTYRIPNPNNGARNGDL